MNLDTWAHVESGPCHATWCDWTGFHWHWNIQHFRSLRELNTFDRAQMDQELRELYA